MRELLLWQLSVGCSEFGRGVYEMPGIATRKHWLIAAFVVVALPAGVYGYHVLSETPHVLDDMLKQMGFHPLKPPTNLFGPGSIYWVSADGNVKETLCAADPSLLDGRLRESPTEVSVEQELESANLWIKGKFGEVVKGAIGSDRIQSEKVSLSDVSVVEISVEENTLVFDILQQRPGCKKAIDDLLKDNEFVCQGQSALIATVQYEVITERESDLAGDLQTIATLSKRAVGSETETKIDMKDHKLTTGTKLSYGVKLNPKCLTGPQATHGMRLGQSWFDRILARVGLEFDA